METLDVTLARGGYETYLGAQGLLHPSWFELSILERDAWIAFVVKIRQMLNGYS